MEKINYQKTHESLKEIGPDPMPNLVKVAIPEAKIELIRGLQYCINEYSWLPEYNEVVEWLTDNKGRGLLCYGNCGRGKTVICKRIILFLLTHYYNKIMSCYDAQDINKDIDGIKSKHIICIDDIGVEKESVKYGEKRMAFPEIVDECEKKGHLLIVTTNLSLNEIAEKYGERTMDRLVAITKRVEFKGKSLRG